MKGYHVMVHLSTPDDDERAIAQHEAERDLADDPVSDLDNTSSNSDTASGKSAQESPITNTDLEEWLLEVARLGSGTDDYGAPTDEEIKEFNTFKEAKAAIQNQINRARIDTTRVVYRAYIRETAVKDKRFERWYTQHLKRLEAKGGSDESQRL